MIAAPYAMGAAARAPRATRSILEIMAELPSGTMPMGASGNVLGLSWDELGVYLARELGQQNEKERNANHALRDQLYSDGGCRFMCGVIDKVFKDPDVKAKRKEWVPYARFTNPLKRIINKISTVYARPAKRSVKSGDDSYQKLLKAIRMDESMLQLSRLLNLHRALLVGFRIRRTSSGELQPVMDIATPANVRALCHPNDDKLVVGWLVRTCYKPVRASSDTPIWNLWTDHERVGLRDDLSVISSSYVVHGLGVNPWTPVTLSPPQAGFWPGEEGEDLVAARIAVWMQGILMLKESKSATKQPVLSGDGAAMARGQAADSENPIELADGQQVTTIDMSMDLDLFRDTADHVTNHAALDYGMTEAAMNNQGVQSAEARELMLQPLYEIRDQQQVPLREFERTYAFKMAAICKVDAPAMQFDAEGFELEFGNEKMKLEPAKEQELFEKRRAAGLTSTVKFMCESRPGLEPEDAQLEIEENIKQETLRNELMRPLQQISGSMGANTPDGAEGTMLQPAADDARPKYAVGDIVVATVDHKPGMSGMTGTITIANEGTPPYYAVRFDDQAAIPGDHKWLAENELRSVGAAGERTDSMRAPQATAGGAGTVATTPDATTDVQKQALNGAQILAVVELIKSVVSGAIPREAGVNTLRVSLQIDAAEAERLLGPEGFEPKASSPRPAPNVLSTGGPPEDSAA